MYLGTTDRYLKQFPYFLQWKYDYNYKDLPHKFNHNWISQVEINGIIRHWWYQDMEIQFYSQMDMLYHKLKYWKKWEYDKKKKNNIELQEINTL